MFAVPRRSLRRLEGERKRTVSTGRLMNMTIAVRLTVCRAHATRDDGDLRRARYIDLAG
ncbi:hypothetical protein X963_4435 [Burkholderia pseudomallei MSHR7498]|nr:hypothetical protein DO73_3970 [Burkholderia pseudomallei]KGS05325.1 hypothetical protein X977_3586 [Burkholderia pseudomallei MSHR7504]KGS67473.1 hypothetical protein X990_3720 [Burkholderia pseudomallei MSHR4868]KGS81443.1 hypothetical protein X947_3866 [Burkholderia pseudomallei MSHR7334]KGS93631.1 hypothetical protein X963_4435 [Burkholderia pseudomallei MSHR7498]KGW28847.1 hypothetical protein Y045_5873 [Burkholderia pseudomallei MSHR2451]KGX55878.1 hypothetical protein Y025_3983 [Bur